MGKKHLYWLGFGILFCVILVFIALLPDHDLPLLYIENALSEQTSLSINDIYTLKGIDFNSLRSSYQEINDIAVQSTISVLERFYSAYKDEKGASLVKVFYIDQIIQKCDLRDFTYTRLVFTSADGESVVVEPTEYEDYLCLLTLEKGGGKYFLRLVLPLDSSESRWMSEVVRVVMW